LALNEIMVDSESAYQRRPNNELDQPASLLINKKNYSDIWLLVKH
jgi:hypothetical protein